MHSNHRLRSIVLFCVLPLGASAQDKGTVEEQVRALGAKVDAARQTSLEHLVRLNSVAFALEYGDTVRHRLVQYPNRQDGLTPGYVFTPAKLEKGRKYPGLIVLHGSNHGHFGPEFFELIATAVTKGYIVMFPEYAGSSGYGLAQYEAVDYSGHDVDDALAAADYLVSRHDFVDPARLGIYGFSHGGLIVLCALEREPKKFKAAVHMSGLVDLVADLAIRPQPHLKALADMPRFQGTYAYGNGIKAYIEASPINYVELIETPLLILATSSDFHVASQLHAKRLAEVMKSYGKTFEYKLFENAPGAHLFSYGDSEASRQAFAKTFEFLAKYLHP